MQRLLPASVLEPREQLQIVRALRAEGEYEAAAVACDDFTTAYAAHAKAELVRLLVPTFRGVASLDEVGEIEQAMGSPEVLALAREGASATMSVSRFTEVVCGFSMTD